MVAILIALVLASGCQTSQDGALSPAANDPDHQLCTAEGYQPGTEGHGLCILELRLWNAYLRSLEQILYTAPPVPGRTP
jgi:hypothetical protein